MEMKREINPKRGWENKGMFITQKVKEQIDSGESKVLRFEFDTEKEAKYAFDRINEYYFKTINTDKKLFPIVDKTTLFLNVLYQKGPGEELLPLRITEFTGQVQIKVPSELSTKELPDYDIVGVIPGIPKPDIESGSEVIVVSGTAKFSINGVSINAKKEDSFIYTMKKSKVQIKTTAGSVTVSQSPNNKRVLKKGEKMQIDILTKKPKKTSKKKKGY